jgi:uncharacterized protein YyaL (SSP411 family)
MLSRCRSGRTLAAAALCALLLTGDFALAIKDEAAVGTKANRLAKETSPYLKLHAHNPVDWYPWGSEALEKARAENKPIFLSIGYSSCFWCHVMERKVFENPEIAAYMNSHFVNIKVDREERPDLDDLYMLSLQVYMQATGAGDGGGWPLSMFLTPEGKPIAGGTYFPPDELPGRPGFPGVLKRVHEIWTGQEAQVRGSADVLAREVQRLSGPSPLSVAKAPSVELVQRAVDELVASRDPEFGGFGFNADSANRPKFPQPSKLLFLAHHADQKPAGEALDFTLERMARGGLYDHLAGGFHRYSTDRKWLVPHFEKMLYDNSQLAEVYAIEAKRTGRADFQKVAHETLQFVLRDLCDARGGFYSALDAETNGVEGAYYVWSPEEVQKVLVNDAPLFAAAYGVDQETTFEHGHVLHRVKSDEELSKAFGGTPAEVASRLAAAKERLLDVRRQRPALLRDDKVIVAWNGQMIRSLAVCGKLLNEPGYVAAADRAAMFILTTMRDAEGGLKRTYCEGQASNAACLDDYAFLIDGIVALHEVTGDEKWLNAARRLMDDQIEQYWDERSGGFFFTADHHEPLIARMKDGYDSVMPSGNSVSVDALTRLFRITKDAAYQSRAEKSLAAFGSQIEQSPAGFARMLLAAEEVLRQPQPETVAVAPAAPADVELLAKAPPKPKLSPSQAPMPAGEKEKLQVFTQPAAAEAAKHQHVKGRVYLSADKLTPGTSTKVALVLDIGEGWHVNANPAKPDYVRPAELELSSAAGIELTDIVYPQGKDLKMADQDEPVSVYEGQAVIYGTLKVPQDAKVTSDELKFLLKYQACDHKQCLAPARMKLDGKIEVGAGAKRINARVFGEK